MVMYDVFIKDPDEYAGGFEVRVPEANDESDAIAEALDVANSELRAAGVGPKYDADDVGSVRKVTL